MSDVIYYNLTLQTENPLNSGDIIQSPSNPSFRTAETTANNNIPIVHDPSQYYCSVVRMAIPGEAIPLVQFLVQTPIVGGAFNKGVYGFTMSYDTTVSTQYFVEYEPQNITRDVPIPPSDSLQQQFGLYYFIYTYQHICYLLNRTLSLALADLKIRAGGSGSPIAGAKDPFFYYNPQNQRIELYADNYFNIDNPSAGDHPLIIWFNEPCYVFFPQMDYRIYDLDAARFASFTIKSRGLNVTWLPPTPPGGSVPPGQTEYIVNSQELVSTSYMSPLRSILVTTTMNIRPESFNLSIPHNDQSGSQNTGFTNVLTDYLPDISQPSAGITSYKFIYNAESLYRIFEFYQKDPLYTINANILWTDNLGNQYPLLLSKGQTASLKFMFIKKGSPAIKLLPGLPSSVWGDK